MVSYLQIASYFLQIIAEAITFLIGGLHNTGYLLAWVVHYLTVHKNIYHELLNEMKTRVGSDCGELLKSYAYDNNTCVTILCMKTFAGCRFYISQVHYFLPKFVMFLQVHGILYHGSLPSKTQSQPKSICMFEFLIITPTYS